MAMKRRGFLGGIAAAFATTPEKVLKAAGVEASQLGQLTPSGGIISGGLNATTYGSPGLPWYKAEKARVLAMRTFAPWLLEKKRRRQAYHVGSLDVNIASLRSVSPAAKIAMQRELNYRRQLDDELASLDFAGEEQEFQV